MSACARGRFGEWNLKETDLLNTLQLITAKPTVYLINLTEKAYINKKNKWLIKARALSAHKPSLAVHVQGPTPPSPAHVLSLVGKRA